MKRKPIDELVYDTLFPRPKPSDPQNFQSFLTRCLIGEVRHEVHAFYGHIDDEESKYPGLDYCHPTHRIRLSRWTWHRRLFRAFDLLRLTENEIYGLTKWEGTKWAKERYEREQGVTIRDTTADGFSDWVEPGDRAATPALSEAGSLRSRIQAASIVAPEPDGDDESEDEVQSSVGVELNERLRQRVAAHNAGDTSQPLDEEWEQWLKNAIESGEFPLVAEQITRMARQPQQPAATPPDGLSPARVLGAARAGRWHEVPDFLHDMIGRGLEEEERLGRRSSAAASASGSPSRSDAATASMPAAAASAVPFPTEPASGSANPAWRRSFSGLRLPDGTALSANSFRAQPTAQTPGA